MQQQAIVFHENNADLIAKKLYDYTAPQLLEEYGEMLERYPTLVLCVDILDSGFTTISYVVTTGMFERNAPQPIQLNDKTFTFVRNV